ncbi:hypothetical protein [Paraburkholderia heleia]|uniref:hypothetical protein n=1 Tax=Paraburkholderia heleia TaxID=634127 RepID=UPI002AB778DD|nr:hypothetical protein [Paraburkholderia heleia]
MVNKALLSTIISLLVVIAGYVGYLAWDRHQHNLQEEVAHQRELAWKAQFLGTTPDKLQQEETPAQREQEQADYEAAAKAVQK